jgi:hypothetical protein
LSSISLLLYTTLFCFLGSVDCNDGIVVGVIGDGDLEVIDGFTPTISSPVKEQKPRANDGGVVSTGATARLARFLQLGNYLPVEKKTHRMN